MSRVIKRPGDVFRFPARGAQHGYAQWLPDGSVRVFGSLCDEALSLEEIAVLPVAFRVMVFKDTPGRYDWKKVGHLPIPSDCAAPQRYGKQDSINGRITIYYDGNESPATFNDVITLEVCAVWAHPHLVERLTAIVSGTESAFLKSIEIKPPSRMATTQDQVADDRAV